MQKYWRNYYFPVCGKNIVKQDGWAFKKYCEENRTESKTLSSLPGFKGKKMVWGKLSDIGVFEVPWKNALLLICIKYIVHVNQESKVFVVPI